MSENKAKLLPYYENPKPCYEDLRKVLFREGRPDAVPIYELFANPEIIDSFMGDLDAGTGRWRFYAWAGYAHVPTWPKYDCVLGDLVDTRKPYPIKTLADLRAYAWPTEISYEDFARGAEEIPDGMRLFGQMGGPFETAQMLVGFQNFCYMLYDEPELIDEMFERIDALYEEAYRGMAKQPKVGALIISDDLGYKCGTLLSAEHLRRYVKPIHAKIARIAHEANLPCILHSCGQLSSIMDEWIRDVGFDAKHSYENSAMPVEQFYREYGDRVAVLGGYDLNELCHDAPETVYGKCRALIDMGRNGGYALGSGNSIAAYVPEERYLAMLQAAADARAAG